MNISAPILIKNPSVRSVSIQFEILPPMVRITVEENKLIFELAIPVCAFVKLRLKKNKSENLRCGAIMEPSNNCHLVLF